MSLNTRPRTTSTRISRMRKTSEELYATITLLIGGLLSLKEQHEAALKEILQFEGLDYEKLIGKLRAKHKEIGIQLGYERPNPLLNSKTSELDSFSAPTSVINPPGLGKRYSG